MMNTINVDFCERTGNANDITKISLSKDLERDPTLAVIDAGTYLAR